MTFQKNSEKNQNVIHLWLLSNSVIYETNWNKQIGNELYKDNNKKNHNLIFNVGSLVFKIFLING